jgi:FkbM family methyltransferase
LSNNHLNMSIEILTPSGTKRHVLTSNNMDKHFSIPINHAKTILDQINSGMYAKWFEGKKDLVCIDIGANVGLVSLYMHPACKELYCLEPTPAHFLLLKELLGEHQNVHIYPTALSGTNGQVVFMTGHSTENKITTEEGYGNGKIKVPGITLSSFLQASNAEKDIIDFIKCDIEGAEIFALTEAELKLTRGKIRNFFVECHPSNNYGMDACREELIKRFKKNGYEIEVIDYQTFVASYEC